MNEKSMGQVEVLSIDGQKYVIGESLARAAGIAPDKSAKWRRNQIERQMLVRNEDYKDYGEDILFSREAAAKILEYAKKAKPPSGDRPRKSKHGYELDEYGLPILPPQERRGALINPYRI